MQSDFEKLANRAANGVSRRLVGIDLFAGVGGMSLGFEQAGFDVLAAVEYDPVHAAVHEFNFPLTSTLCADISYLRADQIIEAAKRGFLAHGNAEADWTGEIDVVFGGPPCQGFSTMGKRAVGDERNKLVYSFASLIGSLRPRYFVMENVPGMASAAQGTILEALFVRLEEYGYKIAISYEQLRHRAILSAADFGVPQARRRLILIGARTGERMPEYPIPTVQSVSKRAQSVLNGASRLAFLPAGPTVWDAIGDIPNLDDYNELINTDEVRLSRELVEDMDLSSSDYAKRLRELVVDGDDFAYLRDWDPSALTSSMRTHHSVESIQRFSATGPGRVEPISRFYKLDAAGLCNTLRAGTGSERGAFTSPRPIHPRYPRVISVREAARLHSFPDWFRMHRTKSNGFRSIGNAVPPLFARAIARTIVDATGMKPYKPINKIRLGDVRLLSYHRLTAAAYYSADRRYIPSSRLRAT